MQIRNVNILWLIFQSKNVIYIIYILMIHCTEIHNNNDVCMRYYMYNYHKNYLVPVSSMCVNRLMFQSSHNVDHI